MTWYLKTVNYFIHSQIAGGYIHNDGTMGARKEKKQHTQLWQEKCIKVATSLCLLSLESLICNGLKTGIDLTQETWWSSSQMLFVSGFVMVD